MTTVVLFGESVDRIWQQLKQCQTDGWSFHDQSGNIRLHYRTDGVTYTFRINDEDHPIYAHLRTKAREAYRKDGVHLRGWDHYPSWVVDRLMIRLNAPHPFWRFFPKSAISHTVEELSAEALNELKSLGCTPGPVTFPPPENTLFYYALRRSCRDWTILGKMNSSFLSLKAVQSWIRRQPPSEEFVYEIIGSGGFYVYYDIPWLQH